MSLTDKLNQAVDWARDALNRPAFVQLNTTVMPWSATARLVDGPVAYWVKIAHPANALTEARILMIGNENGLTALPTLAAFNPGLDALLVEHISGDGHEYSATTVLNTLATVSATLARHADELQLNTLTATSCAEGIASLCTNENGEQSWLDGSVASQLAAAIGASRSALFALDHFLGPQKTVLHGDLHLGNVIRGRSGPVLLDWADAAYGSPLWDESMFGLSVIDSHGGDREPFPCAILADLKGMLDFLSTPRCEDELALPLPLYRVHEWMTARARSLMLSLHYLRNHVGSKTWQAMTR